MLSLTSDASQRANGLQQVAPICVVIPTYNRSSALLTCLNYLEKQRWTDFEVLVVDDGSIDDTTEIVRSYMARSALRIRYVKQENSGPARARNVALSLTQAPVSIIIGDDIFASPDFVFQHLQFHQRHTKLEVAALGLTRWSESGQVVTPFMRWLDESGVQFNYQALLEGLKPSWQNFYTSNLSVKTELLRANPFNEAFRTAAMEDIELGYRLEIQRGLEIVLLPEALAMHLHPTSFYQACRRMQGVGLATRLFDDLWPEQRSKQHGILRRAARDTVLSSHRSLLPPLTFLADTLTRFWCPNPLMRFVLNFHKAIGYHAPR